LVVQRLANQHID